MGGPVRKVGRMAADGHTPGLPRAVWWAGGHERLSVLRDRTTPRSKGTMGSEGQGIANGVAICGRTLRQLGGQPQGTVHRRLWGLRGAGARSMTQQERQRRDAAAEAVVAVAKDLCLPPGDR